MPVPSNIADLSVVAASNSPAGSDPIGATLDDYLRAIQAIARREQAQGAALASAATVNIGATTDGSYLHITGATTITSFGTTAAGIARVLVFDGALTLTHSSSLILPGGANLTTAAGDVFQFVSEGGGVWRCTRASFAAIGRPAASGANSDITSLASPALGSATATTQTAGDDSTKVATTAYVGAAVAANPARVLPVRQTVLSGPVDSGGLPAFGGSTGSTTVTASGTLVATAANGFGSAGAVDRVGQIVNPSWTGLSTNGTVYLYLDIAADGTCTTGSTTLAPVYQWGGTYSPTNGQFTYGIQEMVGKVGNGSTAAQTYRVFVGEVTVAGGVVTAITWYALMGRYDSGWTATLPALATKTSKTHAIGSQPNSAELSVKCLVADAGYVVDDVVMHLTTHDVSSNFRSAVAVRADRLALSVTTGTGYSGAFGWSTVNAITGVVTDLISAKWAYRLTATRGW